MREILITKRTESQNIMETFYRILPRKPIDRREAASVG
ncbi:Uncharacterised protein [Pseudoalteromonas nigrifaciens]|nr:Uncharacterised protein [Pseudoalteromonas nigrifaciens]